MRKLAFGLIIFCVVCNTQAQTWENEEHIWNEKEGKWEVRNRGSGRIVNTIPEDSPIGKLLTGSERPYHGEPWEKYLSKNVKYGRREPSEWELKEAQRKHWANETLKERGRQKAEERKRIMAHRKATGWYHQRYQAGLNQGSMAYRMSVSNPSYGYTGPYIHRFAGCAMRRSDMYRGPNGPGNNYGYKNRPYVEQKPQTKGY